MHLDLSAEQWDAVEAGVRTAPDGRSYTRRTTRAKRKEAAALVERGCPVIIYWPGGLPEKTKLLARRRGRPAGVREGEDGPHERRT